MNPATIPSRPADTVAERFWIKVQKGSACWEWTGCVGTGGYGRFMLAGKARKAHRVAWLLTHGEVAESVRVLHRCDNPKCCNPDHLFLGTQQDNIADMLAKGRHRVPHGSEHVFAKITETIAAEIRALHQAGSGRNDLAARFSVSLSLIDYVLYRRGWRHIP